MKNEIDLNILKIIHLLINLGSVTKTAQYLNLTPGSISYSLKKAREITGKHLFIRTRGGMLPDAMAHELNQRYLKFVQSSQEEGLSKDVKQLDAMTIRSHTLMEMKLAERLTTKLYQYRYAINLPHPWRALQSGLPTSRVSL